MAIIFFLSPFHSGLFTFLPEGEYVYVYVVLINTNIRNPLTTKNDTTITDAIQPFYQILQLP